MQSSDESAFAAAKIVLVRFVSKLLQSDIHSRLIGRDTLYPRLWIPEFLAKTLWQFSVELVAIEEQIALCLGVHFFLISDHIAFKIPKKISNPSTMITHVAI